MVRVKFRYLVVNFLYPSPDSKPRTALPDLIQIHSPTPDAFNAGALVRLLRDLIEDLYGDYGSGMVSSSLKGANSLRRRSYHKLTYSTQSTTSPPPRPQP